MNEDDKLILFLRKLVLFLTQKVVSAGGDPAEFDLGFPVYQQNASYKAGEIFRDQNSDQPFECLTDYDGNVHPDWNQSIATIWKPYHGKDKDHAYPWAAPSGAHDLYKSGEFMTFTDGEIYKALSDTAFSPTDAPQMWEKQT